MTLLQSPPELESTRQSWFTFIEEISLETLLSHLWRLITDISRVWNNTAIIERVWSRLGNAR